MYFAIEYTRHSTCLNVWNTYLAPILNNRMQKSSSVAQNSGTSKYRKCSGKRSVLATYCCIHFHPSQCVLLIVKRLIQILLIIGGVEQNPGPRIEEPRRRNKLSPNRSAAKDAPKCDLPDAKHNKSTLF